MLIILNDQYLSKFCTPTLTYKLDYFIVLNNLHISVKRSRLQREWVKLLQYLTVRLITKCPSANYSKRGQNFIL
jgi:hypothetical protein